MNENTIVSRSDSESNAIHQPPAVAHPTVSSRPSALVVVIETACRGTLLLIDLTACLGNKPQFLSDKVSDREIEEAA
jgi:hypothetical protein